MPNKQEKIEWEEEFDEVGIRQKIKIIPIPGVGVRVEVKELKDSIRQLLLQEKAKTAQEIIEECLPKEKEKPVVIECGYSREYRRGWNKCRQQFLENIKKYGGK